jgi:hypothetical protein
MGNIIDCFKNCFYTESKAKKPRNIRTKFKEQHDNIQIVNIIPQQIYPEEEDYVHLNEEDFDKIL